MIISFTSAVGELHNRGSPPSRAFMYWRWLIYFYLVSPPERRSCAWPGTPNSSEDHNPLNSHLPAVVNVTKKVRIRDYQRRQTLDAEFSKSLILSGILKIVMVYSTWKMGLNTYPSTAILKKLVGLFNNTQWNLKIRPQHLPNCMCGMKNRPQALPFSSGTWKIGHNTIFTIKLSHLIK